jgi:hypothetical protein
MRPKLNHSLDPVQQICGKPIFAGGCGEFSASLTPA